MNTDWAQDDSKKVRLWCIRAMEAPVVGVFARCFAERRWTCVLRWNWKYNTLEEGAWTTMDLSAPRSCLSPDGEFLLYAAKGPIDGPFNAFYGGAYSVSRLPWLAALTDPDTVGPAGSYESRDALKSRSQKRLWAIFQDWRDLGYVKWPYDLGWGWTALPTDDALVAKLPMRHRAWLAAKTENSSEGVALLAVVDCPENRHGDAGWSIWRNDLRYFILSSDAPEARVAELTDVRWAALLDGGRVLTASADARLRLEHLSFKHDLVRTPDTQSEQRLDGLTPRPGPAPSWARVELGR